MTNQQARAKSGKSGFTLIELSIVLVIIGLIVGGVLVGQDLIKAAELRATISQLEKYDAAVNTFRGKYNALPGDMNNAATFGFVSATGNGDGFIAATTAADAGNQFQYEAAAFFSHMADANLISEAINAYAGTGTTKTTNYAAGDIDEATNFMPVSKMGRGTLVTARGANGQNFFFLGIPTVEDGVATYTDGSQIPVIDAFQIDSKLDDGNPSIGRVVSASATATYTTLDGGANAATPTENICKDNNGTADPATSDDKYSTGTTTRANDTECILRIRASF
ncbi:MAG: prepilin-type N-terminal cleavage/methylation domain-containing protein [Alphaproteobacteria bacterium]|nr:prepilin-type N-terminal cleavage/methylation domain-containing protein [Alphaproteobacteria bacterium]